MSSNLKRFVAENSASVPVVLQLLEQKNMLILTQVATAKYSVEYIGNPLAKNELAKELDGNVININLWEVEKVQANVTPERTRTSKKSVNLDEYDRSTGELEEFSGDSVQGT
jgi:hypothetical protein